jgi:predicted oxidoreductase
LCMVLCSLNACLGCRTWSLYTWYDDATKEMKLLALPKMGLQVAICAETTNCLQIWWFCIDEETIETEKTCSSYEHCYDLHNDKLVQKKTKSKSKSKRSKVFGGLQPTFSSRSEDFLVATKLNARSEDFVAATELNSRPKDRLRDW